MQIEICGDCDMFNHGYDDNVLNHDYSTEFPPMSLFAPTDCDTFYAGSDEEKRWVVTNADCFGVPDSDRYCPGHFSTWPCHACGNPKSGTRFCYFADRANSRMAV